ncbi:MAG TPA: menaquinone biosynthesis decarboxylase [Desulfotomaculum sp.]|jgi:4-hydroxy-3-polyprenylbenzoate decarboxylase|nr:menaquinone biosynthesis decarboxylase [Desulfotomaculum sp.]
MAYKDLHEFIAVLESAGELRRIREPVSPILEITQITDRVVKKEGPALLFENVSGYDMPVLTNAFGSYHRLQMALGDELDKIAQRLDNLLKMTGMIPTGFIEKLKAIPRLAEFNSFIPKIVRSGSCQEVIKEDFSLESLPVLKCWPGDGGRFITLPIVFTRDPQTGARNAGMYRLQVYDRRTTGMHWHLHKDGAENFRRHKLAQSRMEAAVAIGTDPAVIYAATAPLPHGVDELLFAGFLRREPVELVRCKTVDLEVPAGADIILEGYVDMEELRLEGPFGDHTGYYSLADYYPVFHVTCLTHRRDAVYPATIVGRPPMEDCYLGKATERIFLPLIRWQVPEIVDMNLPLEGVFHNCAIVSIKKTYPGQARKVMYALWGLGQMMFTKMIIVVEHTVNVHDLSEVIWRVFNNIDAGRDLVIVQGPLDALDHSSPNLHYGAKLGIDATRKWPSEGHPRPWPEDISMSEDIVRLVEEKWPRLGLD